MPSPIKGTKPTKFKLRASEDFPSRDFKVEFSTTGIEIYTAGERRQGHHIRWRPLIGQMLMFRSEPECWKPEVVWRGFTVTFRGPSKILAGVEFLIEFSDKGVRITKLAIDGLPTFWSWRTLLNVAITGI